jgi:hypothetical protein
MVFGHKPQWGEEIDQMILKLLWTKKREGQVHKGRTLVAKNGSPWISPTVDLKYLFSKEIAEGLLLNTLQRLNMQQDAPKGQKTFLLKLLYRTLQCAIASQSEGNVSDGLK